MMSIDDVVKGTMIRLKQGLKDTSEIFWTGGLTAVFIGYHVYAESKLPDPVEVGTYSAMANIAADPIAEWIVPMFDKGIIKSTEDYFGKYAAKPGRMLIEFVMEPLLIGLASYKVSELDDLRSSYDYASMSPSDTMGYLGFKTAVPISVGFANEAFEALSYPAARAGSWVFRHMVEPVVNFFTSQKY